MPHSKINEDSVELRQVAIPVADLERAIRFYSQLLGQDPVATFPAARLAFFSLGKTRLLLDGNLNTSVESSALLYLHVKEVPNKVEELRIKGIRIHTEAHVVFNDSQGTFDVPGEELLAFINDSEGNLLGLMGRRSN